MLHFVFIAFALFPLQTAIISLNSINQLRFVMMKCGVLFEVRTEFLNNTYLDEHRLQRVNPLLYLRPLGAAHRYK
jgi:hypothetical protein